MVNCYVKVVWVGKECGYIVEYDVFVGEIYDSVDIVFDGF